MALPQIPVKVSSGIGILRWIIKHWWLIIFILSIIPGIIVSIQTAKSTGNPVYPLISFGLSIAGGDSSLYNYVKILETNPVQLIGMTYPENGVWNYLVYFWNVAKVVWLLLGSLFLITVPFMLIHRIIKWKNTSEEWKAWGKTFLWFFLYLLFINMLLLIIGLVSGDVQQSFNQDWNTVQKVGYLLYINVPLHGVIELGKYVISLIA